MMSQIPEKLSDALYTDEQWQAIHETGRDILVSASAGSGKTLVLINRLVQKIINGTGIDELLVVTFTKAAAQEMRERLQRELQKAINQLESQSSKQRYHLLQQLSKIGQSYISTIHSFCLKVIQNYYYLIDFDPVFRQLTDDTEIEMIKEDIWNDLFEVFLAEANEEEKYFAFAYSGKRSDDHLQQMVFKLHEFARAHPDSKKWLAHLSCMYDMSGESLADWPFYQQFAYPEIIQELDIALENIDRALMLDDGAKELKTPRIRLESDQKQFQKMKEAVESGDLKQAYQLSEYSFYRWSNGTGDYKEIGQAMKPYRDRAKEIYEDLVDKYFNVSPKTQLEASEQAGRMIRVLADLTVQFMDRYQSYKAERQLIDYSDLEHLTLQILRNEDGTPSEAAWYYQDLFEEVLVDEYQDINRLQEAILQLVSHSGSDDNLFMVGDVKQSIYGFRLADPSLFAQKYERFETEQTGRRIDLLENFRSRPEVLKFTNYLFSQIMDHEIGDIEYDDKAALKFGLDKVYEPDSNFETEILLFDQGKKGSDEDSLKDIEGEIHLTAQRIKELVAEDDPFIIYDAEQKRDRPAQYNDIVLLTPTKMNNALIQEIFQLYQIPVALNETQNFFQTTEISIIMSLLELVDNSIQDIPLVAVLRSPIVGLKENELAQIRLANRTSQFYKALLDFEQIDFVDIRNQETQKKVRHFLNALDHWRSIAKEVPVAELLRKIYQETGYELYVAGMPGGQQRQANLRALRAHAANYEKSSFKGLSRFIHFVEIMRDKDKDLAEPTAAQASENAVRVMTIHASKGLEFPLVFVMNMSRSFNLHDVTHRDYVLDSDYGMGLEYKDLNRHLRISTYPEIFLRKRKQEQLIAEQMRVLYVALTRAEQKLFLVGNIKSYQSAQEEWQRSGDLKHFKIDMHARLANNNYMYWICLALLRQPELRQWEKSEFSTSAGLFDIHVKLQIVMTEDLQISKYNKNAKEDGSGEDFLQRFNDVAMTQELQRTTEWAEKILTFDYPYRQAARSKSNRSVTELKRLFEEPENGQIVKLDLRDSEVSFDRTSPSALYKKESFLEPKFISNPSEEVDALAIGQSTHLLMQKIPLQEKMTATYFKSFANDLANKHLFPKKILSYIPYERLAQFFQTNFGQFIINQKDELRREEPFTMLIPAKRIYPDFTGDSGDQVIVHGVIDGFVEEADGVIIFDYKTDRISGSFHEKKAKLIDRYQGQLKLYQLALEASLQKSVKRSVIVGLNTEMIIDLI